MPPTTTNCGACVDCITTYGDASAFRRMVLCPTCGNKRCPHALAHIYRCTGSNDTGQIGEIFAALEASNMIDLTNDLTALVTRATEALARGETVQIGAVAVEERRGFVVASRDGGAIAWWESASGRRDVLREAIFAALTVTP